jgi:hypothetical protein
MASTLRTISIRPAGAGAYATLADETASPQDVITGLKMPVKLVTQNEPLYGSETPFTAARGNRGFALSFAVTRVFANAELCAAFLQDHLNNTADTPYGALGDTVDIKFVQGAQTFYFPAAVLELIDPDEPTGSSVTIRYRFLCPTFTTIAP